MKRNIFLHKFIATGFGSGYFPIAPGTAGAVVATAIWFCLSLFLSQCNLFVATSLLIIIFTGLGVWSSGIMEKHLGKDPSVVVVDEMVGVWIPLLYVSDGNIYYMLASLVLFRLFDIFKPLGIRKMEKIEGGWGIMLDDILAGIYSLIVIFVFKWIIG